MAEESGVLENDIINHRVTYAGRTVPPPPDIEGFNAVLKERSRMVTSGRLATLAMEWERASANFYLHTYGQDHDVYASELWDEKAMRAYDNFRVLVKKTPVFLRETDGEDGEGERQRRDNYNAIGEYIIAEIMRIYELQGVSTGRKHLEVIVKQMFSRVSITNVGDTGVSAGDIVADFELERLNKEANKAGKEPAKAKQLLMGITEVSLTRASFLSSISFQNTPRKLAEASVSGAVDRLVGLKENVIIGRLIPAGTGFKGSKKHVLVEELEARMALLHPKEEEAPRDVIRS
jgi:hypothetical protein